MKLSLKNIGKIRNATVELNGITVIAGENNSGKSTVGKVLYSVFNSFYNIEHEIRKERISSVENMINILAHDIEILRNIEDMEAVATEVVDCSYENDASLEWLKKKVLAIITQYDDSKNYIDDDKVRMYLEQLCELLLVSNDEILKSILFKRLTAEFNGQISNIYTKEHGEIGLQIKDKIMSVFVSNEGVKHVDNQIALRTETVYIDDPFVLDELTRIRFTVPNAYLNHRQHLKNKLNLKEKQINIVEEIVAINKFEKIYEMISLVCAGDIVRTNRLGWGYQEKNGSEVLNIKNLSTGMKTFVILKRLLVNGVLEMNGTIILDEPEIHLHPEWQLVFAELIVLLQKEFGMHILLNTHSPYFLNAIEVYAAKHEIADKCKYYMTEEVEECSDIVDVTNNIEAIYAKLARPLQRLENERYMND
ncbi:MAG: AAA family ATPase [Tyzzerella sp.]|nr:AAA family ATPase [Tyzzerella sp.]